MLKIFPYLKDVKIDLAWGGPMACSPNLFPQIGTLPGRSNAFLSRVTQALASPRATSSARCWPKA